jgi:Ca2+-binding RTX toxin-like protein
MARVLGTTAKDELPGSDEADEIFGFEGDDTLVGLGGDDDLFGGAGKDVLDGGAGADEMDGGADSDLYIVQETGDRIIEGEGDAEGAFDEVRTDLSSYTLPSNVEKLTLLEDGISGIGNDGPNVITGNAAINDLRGGLGRDELYGLGGNDDLDGGRGADLLVGGPGDDIYLADFVASFKLEEAIVEQPGEGSDIVYLTADWVSASGAGRADFNVPEHVEQVVVEGNRPTSIDALFAPAAVTIRGGTGGDKLFGSIFADALDGNAGDDAIRGEPGNDLIDGGAGSDTAEFLVVASEARISRTSGGAIVVSTKTLGRDTLISVEKLAFKDKTLDVAKDSLFTGDIDLVFLQDLSGSFRDDLPNVAGAVRGIAAEVKELDPEAAFAVASFVDKPVPDDDELKDDYVYKAHLGRTDDAGVVANQIANLVIRSGGDFPEAQLDGLEAAALGTGLSLRPEAHRIVLLSTDADFHAGDGYASVAEVKATLEATGAVPIFAVTSDVRGTYQQLVEDLGVGAVVTLTRDSNNLQDAVRQALANLFQEVTSNGSDGADNLFGGFLDEKFFTGLGADSVDAGDGDDTVDTGAGDDTARGGAGNDTVKGGTGDDLVDGGPGDDALHPGLGRDRVATGPGADTVKGTAAELDDDTIFDFAAADSILMFGAALSPKAVTTSLGSLILDIDSDANGSFETRITLEGDFTGKRVALETEGSGATVATRIRVVDKLPVNGTPGNDKLKGTEDADLIRGLAGNDKITALGGDDVIEAGPGKDKVDGGLGRDVLVLDGPSDGFGVLVKGRKLTILDTDSSDGDEGSVAFANIEVLRFEDFEIDISGGVLAPPAGGPARLDLDGLVAEGRIAG